MSILVTALVQLVVGIAEKLLPTFVAMWAKRQEQKAADVKLAAVEQKIADAVKEAQK